MPVRSLPSPSVLRGCRGLRSPPRAGGRDRLQEPAADHIDWGRMFAEECPFKVVRTNGGDEVLAQAANLLIGRAAFGGSAPDQPD